jgi:hypothetical protein
MVDRSETTKKVIDVEYFKYAVYEVEVSTSDTVTLADFTSSTALLQAVLVKMSDGSALTCSISNNVVTVTGTATNLLCVLFAFGRKA